MLIFRKKSYLLVVDGETKSGIWSSVPFEVDSNERPSISIDGIDVFWTGSDSNSAKSGSTKFDWELLTSETDDRVLQVNVDDCWIF